MEHRFLLRLLVAIIFALFISISLLYGLLIYIKENTLFHPVKTRAWTPPDPPQDLYLTSGRERIHAWHWHNFPNAPIVLFCHGNTGNISHREYMYEFCQTIQYNLLLLDYTGFGYSTGNASLRQLERDGLTAYDYLIQFGYQPNDVLIWAKSLGGHVGSYIAAHRTCRYLVLMATFSSFDHILRFSDYPLWARSILAALVERLTEVEPNYQKVARVKSPVCILHSQEDELIPFHCAEVLYQNIKSPKKLVVVQGGHASPRITRQELAMLLDFCQIEARDWPRLERWLKRLEKLVFELGL